MQCERIVTVGVRDGLHARPATQFVKLAKQFGSTIEVGCRGVRANAKSSVKLMLLGIKEREEITLHAVGEDAAHAVERLAAFIVTEDAGLEIQRDAAPRMAEPESAPLAPPRPPTAPAGTPASRGTALGPAHPFFPPPLTEMSRAIVGAEIEQHVEAYRAAVVEVGEILQRRRNGLHMHPEDAEIIEALIDVARDVELAQATEQLIRSGLDATASVLRAGTELSDAFAAVEDPYIRARAEDIRTITRRIALRLLGREEATLTGLPPGAIVLADELGILDLAEADLSAVGGIVCRQGTVNSHIAIMARAHGIPLVVGCTIGADRLKEARQVALDGATGDVHIDPEPDLVARIESTLADERDERVRLEAYRLVEPMTRTGRRIEVAANLGSPKEIAAAQAAGAMGVGLLRTEFLFMERRSPPDENEQMQVYRRFAEAFAPHPVIVRTLDVGGDKPVPGVPFPKEENPFLGWRGVRLCLDRPELFKPQIRALLRAATIGNIKVMVPMISDVGEVHRVRQLIEECRAELDREGLAHGRFDLGIMMETPACALLADELAGEVAFFSIGTNDLTQYVMAADRLNPRVAALNRADHPAVLRAIRLICEAAGKAGIPVGICGEAAANLDLIPTFIGFGVTELSMSPGAILRAKKCVTEIG
ncbi:phosphoenolpyruvate--protein phosphotransferase [Methylobacterium sp. ID0610]|uniref:phosphoenolpyruvate--protein phosphotransferase n=1 Tax=Methylobacterium carpenticola TaxID=3344827 RepID=UPI00367C2F1D